MPENAEAEVPENDVTTLDGWLAEYDRLAAKYHRERSWCDLRWAYSRDTGGEDHVPSPERRKAPAGRPPAGCLTEEGVAWFAAQDEDSLSRKKRGARRAIIYGLRNSNLTLENAEEAVEQLQLGTISPDRPYYLSLYITQSEYYKVEKQLSDAKRRDIEGGLAEVMATYLTSAGVPAVAAKISVTISQERATDQYAFVPEG
jgi:hypothetical protein